MNVRRSGVKRTRCGRRFWAVHDPTRTSGVIPTTWLRSQSHPFQRAIVLPLRCLGWTYETARICRLLGATVGAWPLTARAQPKVPVIGFLSVASANPFYESGGRTFESVASDAAIVMSHSIANSQPPSSAWPWTEAITGFFGADSSPRWRRRLRFEARRASTSSAARASVPAAPPARSAARSRRA